MIKKLIGGCFGAIIACIVVSGLLIAALAIVPQLAKSEPAQQQGYIPNSWSQAPAQEPAQGDAGFQVGPWHHNGSDDNAEGLYLNILFPHKCVASVSMTVDNQPATASLIYTGDLRRFEELPLDQKVGQSCNYRLSHQPNSSFSVKGVKYPLAGGGFSYSTGIWTR